MFQTLKKLSENFKKNINDEVLLNNIGDEIMQYLVKNGYDNSDVKVSVNRDYDTPILTITTYLGDDIDIPKWFELGSKVIGKIIDSGYYAIQMLWSKGIIFECMPMENED